nr:hypothetical protein [Tanacetum cinerariifolium]
PSATGRTVPPAQEPQVRQSSTASTTITDIAPTPTNSSSLATNIPITSQDVDELNPNVMVNGKTFVNPIANSSTSAVASSSSQNVDPSNMHTFYQPYPHEFHWTKDHPLEQNHFFKGTIDPTLFIRRFQDDILVPLRNVDDGGNDVFPWFTSNQSPCGIFINQSKYVLEILNKYGIESCDPIGTPMEIKDKLDLDQNGTPVDATKYRSMIGALMYLTSSRPDIVHATYLCARYQAKPTEKHLKEVKRIFCYLRGTVNTGLWYTKDSGFELTGFLDADYAGCKDTFKSTSGGAQFLGEKLVSWSLKKQDCTTLSTAEAEYVSLSACCAQEHVEKGTIELYFVKTDYQLADIFTKALPTDRFNYLVRRLGMRSLSPKELERLVYVDNIIFGSTYPRYIQLFSDLMKNRFEMSMMGEMTFFLGLQVNQSPCGIFINQSKYVLEILNKYGMESCDPVDADYAGCKDTFKSTSGSAQFLGEKLVSWSSKKQDCTTLSTAEAEYVSLSACCAQVL